MDKLNNSTEKLCSFYISDWHLVTMILPYINKELNEKANIVTVLENNIEENIKTLISKLNLKNEKKILAIDWKNVKEKESLEINQKLEKLQSNSDNIILIKGSKTYIENININIAKILNKRSEKLKNTKIKIIDCYEVTDFNGNIKDILDTHDKILNTAGEKEIAEVFEGYSKMGNVC